MTHSEAYSFCLKLFIYIYTTEAHLEIITLWKFEIAITFL